MKHFFVFLACFITSVLISNSAHAQVEIIQPTPPKQEVVIGTTAALTTVNPLLLKTVADKLLIALMHRPITALNPSLQPICMICDKLPTLENGLVKSAPTAKNGNLVNITVRLPQNAVWGDGTALSTKDILFTWQTAKTLLAQGVDLPFYRQINDITILSEQKFTISLSNSAYTQYFLHDFYPLAAHATNLSVEQKIPYTDTTRYKTTPFDVGLFAGPYRLTELDSTRAVVVPSTAWWGANKPILQKITVKVFPHAEALQEALLKKQVDVILPPAGLNFDQAFETLKTSLDGRQSRVALVPSTTLEHLIVNVQNPVLQDVRVRQALSLSIDREKFNAFAFQGKRFVSSSFAHSAIVTTAPQTKSFNPEEAAALLDAAGFKKGSDGVLVNDKQQRLSFSFLTVRDDPSFTTLQQLIANAWREAGIETTLESAPLRDLEQRIMPQRLFTGVALLRTTMPHNIQVPPMFLASISIPNAENAYRGENYSGWQNEMADRLLAALTTTIDPSAANANYNVLESLYKTELPTLPLYFTPALSVFPTAFEGIAITAGHNAQTLGAENWFFTPPAAVKIRKERELF